MANYPLNRVVFNKEAYEKTIDISFAQVQLPPPPLRNTITVPEFFELYNTIFYDIPTFGDINSHDYLVKTSGDYIGGEQINQDIQILLDEITTLRQENLKLNQEIVALKSPQIT
jgi:hypothetical protein